MHTSHHDKAQILWEAYKERLGHYEGITMQLNLDVLISSHPDVSSLEDPFTTEEIDQVVASLPSDKSPSPDGIYTDFIKRCWLIIKHDFYKLCQDFYSANICL